MHPRSIGFRLTLWYAVVLTAALAVFGGLLWFSMRQRLLADLEADLASRAARFENFFAVESAETSGGQLQDELQEFCQGLPAGSHVELVSSNFAFTYGPPPRGETRSARRDFSADGQNYSLEVSASAAGVLRTLDLLRWLLLSLIPVIVALACAGGAWLARRALNPVEQITAAAHSISIENLSARLPVPASADELARLSEVLNTMLARLESAVKTLSQFAADASHEMRTPVSVIRTTAELALRRERSAEAYRESLELIAAEAARMTALIEDLLALARSGTSAAEMPLEPVDLSEVLAEVSTAVRGIAELRQIQIRIERAPAIVSGNRAALYRLFLVLLDNALKYSRDGGEVIAAIRIRGEHAEASVSDSGEGIPAADLPHIFERFFQAGRRAGRARESDGHGLGLALAQNIARAHAASIEVESREGEGSTFRVVFPLRAEQTEASANLQSAHV